MALRIILGRCLHHQCLLSQLDRVVPEPISHLVARLFTRYLFAGLFSSFLVGYAHLLLASLRLEACVYLDGLLTLSRCKIGVS